MQQCAGMPTLMSSMIASDVFQEEFARRLLSLETVVTLYGLSY